MKMLPVFVVNLALLSTLRKNKNGKTEMIRRRIGVNNGWTLFQ
jgi:hypothetical protein